MGTSTAGLLWEGLSKDDVGLFREKPVSACSHSERLLIAVNELSQVFRQDHRRGIMIRISFQRSMKRTGHLPCLPPEEAGTAKSFTGFPKITACLW